MNMLICCLNMFKLEHLMTFPRHQKSPRLNRFSAPIGLVWFDRSSRNDLIEEQILQIETDRALHSVGGPNPAAGGFREGWHLEMVG